MTTITWYQEVRVHVDYIFEIRERKDYLRTSYRMEHIPTQEYFGFHCHLNLLVFTMLVIHRLSYTRKRLVVFFMDYRFR